MKELETKLEELLVTKAPYQLPENVRLAIVKILPWLALVGGVLMACSAWQAYYVTTLRNNLTDSYYSTMNSFGYTTGIPVASPLVWASLVALVAEAILLIIAFSALKERKRKGWSLLYWTSLLGVAYEAIVFLTTLSLSALISSLIGSCIGLYVLFQVRRYYTVVSVATSSSSTHLTPPTDPHSDKKY